MVDRRIMLLCTYPLSSSSAQNILDVARTHHLAIIRRTRQWEVIEAPALVEAKTEIKRLNEELEQRVADRTRELARTNELLVNEISERKQVESELRRQKEILQTIFDNIPVMINFVRADGSLEMINREWSRVLGWSMEDIHKANLDIIAECYPEPQLNQEVWKFITETNAEWRDFKTRVRSGQVIDTAWAMVHLSDRTSIGIGQDITERKRREEQLEATSERLRVLIESLRRAKEEEGTRIAREIHDELRFRFNQLEMGTRSSG